jgi:hypothetical protein
MTLDQQYDIAEHKPNASYHRECPSTQTPFEMPVGKGAFPTHLWTRKVVALHSNNMALALQK